MMESNLVHSSSRSFCIFSPNKQQKQRNDRRTELNNLPSESEITVNEFQEENSSLHAVASAPSNVRARSPITLNLFPVHSAQKTDNIVSKTEGPSTESGVSMALCLYDKTWASSRKRIKIQELEQKPRGVEDGRNQNRIPPTDPWKIKKILTESDLGNQYRLLISAALIKEHVIPFFHPERAREIESKNGLSVEVKDCDTNTVHNLVLKKWPKSQSYVFIGGWKPNFVSRRNLKVDDQVGLFWNASRENFHFCVLNRVE